MTIRRFGIDFCIPDEQIYLDSATVGKMPLSSLQKMTEFYETIGGAPVRSMSQDTLKTTDILEENRNTFSQIFNVEKQQVSFLPSREVGLINALFSLDFLEESKIITSILEEHSLLAPSIRAHEFFNTKIDYLNLKDEIDIISSLENKLSLGKSPEIVLLSSLAMTNGVKRDWETISKLCKDMGAIFILDISHSVGHKVFNFKENAPDIVIGSGSIGALGPQGISFQITSNEIEKNMEPLIVGSGSILGLEEYMFQLGGTGSNFEAGIVNVAGIIALVNSLIMLTEVGFEKIELHEKRINDFLRKELQNTPNIQLMEIENAEYGPIISFGCDVIESHDIAMVLEEMKNIVLRSGALCSHLFMYEQKFNDLVRISTHLYNTEEEAKILLETFNQIISEM